MNKPQIEIQSTRETPVFQLDRSADEEHCSVCRGAGCSICAWIGTTEASELYWETRSLIAHFLHAA